MPREAAEVLYDREIRETFDIEDPLAVVVETRDPAGIFNLRTLRLLDELTHRLQALEGIDPGEVTSLATEHSRRSGRNALDFDTFLDPFPETAEDLDRLREDVAAMGLYPGTLVSLDGGEPRAGRRWKPSASAILVGVEPDSDRQLLHRRVRQVVEALGETPETLHVVGAPVAESILGTHILADLALLVPFAVVVMGLLFYLRYRGLAAVLLPITEVAACLVFVFGSMGHAGVPVSLTLTVMPVILTAIGVADEIHIFDRFAHFASRRVAGTGHRATVRLAMDEMWRPVVKTSVTTAIAFLSFTLSPIAPVRHFGIFTALGVGFCMLWSLTVIPAGLALVPRARFATALTSAWPRRFADLGGWVRRRRRLVLAATALTVLAMPFGLVRVRVQDSWLDGFARSSTLRRSTERVNHLFHGTHILLVVFDARPGGRAGELRPVPGPGSNGTETGAAGDPAVPLRLGLELPDFAGLDPSTLLGESILFSATPAEAVARRRREPEFFAEVTAARREDHRIRVEMSPMLSSRKRGFLGSRPQRLWSFFATGERLLDPRLLGRIHQLGELIGASLAGEGGGVLDPTAQISAARYLQQGGREEERRIGDTPIDNRGLLSVLGRIRGEPRVEELFDGSRQRALITVFLEDASFIAVGRLMEAILEYARKELTPVGVTVGFAGDVAVSQAMIGAIVDTQSRSLLLSLVGIFLVAALLGGSVRQGALCLLPPALAVAVHFALMGALGIPLGVATSMFSAMTLGIGVDFAIHLTERHRDLAAASNRGGEPLCEALAVTGPAIVMNTLVLAAGFGVMLLSRVPANARLGLFVVASVSTCLLATLILLPLWIEGRGVGLIPPPAPARRSRSLGARRPGASAPPPSRRCRNRRRAAPS